MIPESDPPIRRNDRTPSTIAQAEANGWEAGLYDFGKGEAPGITWFNPGLIRRPDGLWLLPRRAENVPGSPFGSNSIWAIKLDESGRNPTHGTRLRWTGATDGQHHEDSRAFYVPHMNQVGIFACTFLWHGQNSWTGAIQTLGFFSEDWQCKVAHYPAYSTNARSLENITKERFEKNWCPWHDGSHLRFIYKSDPWTVAEIGDRWSQQRTFVNESARWAYGEIRGGTPPVLVDGKLYTFFHSSVEWRGNYRRYYMGAICFSAEAPFEVLSVTKEPLLIGSQQDPWEQRKPPCCFPGGAECRDGKWFIVYGVNDLRAAWVEIPHADVLARLGDNPGPAIVLKTPEPEALIEAVPESEPPSIQRVGVIERSAHAHAIRAEKLAAKVIRGIKKPRKKPKPKRKKKPKRILTPEQLEKLRENIAKARAARAEKKRLAV